MKRNFRTLVIFLALLATLAVLMASCSSKKKSLDIQKEHLEQASAVKIEQLGTITDNSTFQGQELTKSWSKVVEEWFYPDSNLTSRESGINNNGLKYRKTTYTKQSKQKDQVIQNAVQSTSSVSKDSTGTIKKESKHKVQNKEVKESTSGKLYGIGFLILAVLVAVWYIKRQTKRAKEVVDLFV